MIFWKNNQIKKNTLPGVQKLAYFAGNNFLVQSNIFSNNIAVINLFGVQYFFSVSAVEYFISGKTDELPFFLRL